MRNVSSTFISLFKPLSDAITSDGNAANNVVFMVMKFLAVTAKICKKESFLID